MPGRMMPGRIAKRRRRALAVTLLAAAAIAASGCSKRGGGKKLEREEGAQPVVVVETSAEAEAVRMTDEREPNDEVASAFALEPGAGVRGSLESESDVDTFRVTVAEPGMLTARLGGIEGVDLKLDLLDGEGQVLAHSDRGPAQTIEGIAGFSVEQGDYYLAVGEFISKRKARRREKGEPGREGPSPVYELTAALQQAPAKDHEREPNDGVEGAIELLIGDEGFGYIGWTRDTDLWKLSVEGFTEQYSLDLDLDGVPGVTLTLDILDSGGTPVLHREGEQDKGLSVRNLVPAVAGAGAGAGTGAQAGGSHYYAKITARRSNPVDTYRIRVATRLLELDEELEPNDQPEQATPLRAEGQEAEGKRRGFLTIGDTDRYRLEAGTEPVLLSVEVAPGGDVDPILTVASDTGTLGMADGGKRGEREHLSAVRIPVGQAAVVQISGHGGLGTGAAYELIWTVEPDSGGPAGPGGAVEQVFDDYED